MEDYTTFAYVPVEKNIEYKEINSMEKNMKEIAMV